VITFDYSPLNYGMIGVLFRFLGPTSWTGFLINKKFTFIKYFSGSGLKEVSKAPTPLKKN